MISQLTLACNPYLRHVQIFHFQDQRKPRLGKALRLEKTSRGPRTAATFMHELYFFCHLYFMQELYDVDVVFPVVQNLVLYFTMYYLALSLTMFCILYSAVFLLSQNVIPYNSKIQHYCLKVILRYCIRFNFYLLL